MNVLLVRELASGEESLWFELGEVTEGGDERPSESERLAKFRDRFEERPAGDARTFLVALDGSRLAGRLEGVFLDKKTYLVIELRAAEGFPCSPVEDALVGHLARSFTRGGIGVFSSDRPKNAEINKVLDRAGFEVAKKKAFVSRSLKDDLPRPETEFSFRSLFDVGKPEFLRMMTEASEGDPFEDADERDPEAEFAELVDGAGDKFDPANWMLAHVDGEPVGVVLPQVFADRETEGTLFYVAVLPRFRGRGYGRALHATGLSILAERGVTRYIGSTDTRNAPMLRVFEANGCPQTTTQFFYRPPTAPAVR